MLKRMLNFMYVHEILSMSLLALIFGSLFKSFFNINNGTDLGFFIAVEILFLFLFYILFFVKTTDKDELSISEEEKKIEDARVFFVYALKILYPENSCNDNEIELGQISGDARAMMVEGMLDLVNLSNQPAYRLKSSGPEGDKTLYGLKEKNSIILPTSNSYCVFFPDIDFRKVERIKADNQKNMENRWIEAHKNKGGLKWKSL